MSTNNKNICIITYPRPNAGIVPLKNLIKIVYSLSNKLYVITGNEGSKSCRDFNDIIISSVNVNIKEKMISKIISYILLQLRISLKLISFSKNIDICLFFMGEGLFLPVITAKLLNIPIVLSLTSSLPNTVNSKQKNYFYSITKYLEILNYSISDILIIYSSNLIDEWNLQKYKSKILVAHEHILNLNIFNSKNRPTNTNTIGYFGRFSSEKGCLNFIKSLPCLLEYNDTIMCHIGGGGLLESQIKNYLNKHNLNSNVQIFGWIPHNELPYYLRQLKLIVIPSYTEGLPNIMLEAMACGTIVLATPVGAIPDIIMDGKTGFIMENNSPECIAKNIIRILEYPDLDKIARNARALVEDEYTYEAAVEGYKLILNV